MYIHFSYDSFRELIGESFKELPQELIQTLDFKKNAFLFFSQTSKTVNALCHTLIRNPFSGKSRAFYTEAKVMELMAHLLDVLVKPPLHDQVMTPPLTPLEMEKVRLCYEELQQHLADPPSLLEMAKRAGLSVYRLKNGFVLQYGDTPYRLLTEMRMLRAKELLENQAFNVSEVAMEVGYTSLGSFSNAFFEKFGLRPSAYKK